MGGLIGTFCLFVGAKFVQKQKKCANPAAQSEKMPTFVV